jgi:hypothetical protein
VSERVWAQALAREWVREWVREWAQEPARVRELVPVWATARSCAWRRRPFRQRLR